MEQDTNLSSRDVFHFTNKESLKNILKEGFRPRYVKEPVLTHKIETSFIDQGYCLMVSFCDIPIELSSPHRKLYGRYGIGLSKEWAKYFKCLNPVIYIQRQSFLHDYLIEIYKNLWNRDPLVTDESIRIATMEFYKIIPYLKLYSGPFEHKKYKNFNHKFYDEREWRYIPLETPPRTPILLPTEEEKPNEDNIPTIKINPIHVDYIIVKEESEIEEFKIYLSKLSYNLDITKIFCIKN